MQAKAKGAQADAQIGYEKQLDEMRRMRDEAQAKMKCAHHGDPATESMNIRPPIPWRSDHWFHEHPATLV